MKINLNQIKVFEVAKGAIAIRYNAIQGSWDTSLEFLENLGISITEARHWYWVINDEQITGEPILLDRPFKFIEITTPSIIRNRVYLNKTLALQAKGKVYIKIDDFYDAFC